MPGPPFRPASEATFTITPPPRCRRYGTPYFAPRKQERGLTRISRSHSSSANSVTRPERWAPALLTMTSMPPIVSAAECMSASTEAASVTSQPTKEALPPAASMSAAVWRPPASLMSPITTVAPSRAKRRAVARPMPVAAPVMTASLPDNCMSCSLAQAGDGRGGDLVVLDYGASGDSDSADNFAIHAQWLSATEGDQRPRMAGLDAVKRLSGL